jgi:cytochrome P450
MASYLQRFDATPAARRWALVKGWMQSEPLPFFKELRRRRPVLATSQATLVARYADCCGVLMRPDVFSVALYKPKQGDYWMAQDDTAIHHREKAIMHAVLDYEQIPAMRAFVAAKAAALLDAGNGEIEAVNGLTRAVPIALVQEFFGYADADGDEMRAWSHWNQYDAFHNQPFDQDPDGAGIVAKREAANLRMRDYLIALVQRRGAELKAGQPNKDMVTRLLRLALSQALQFDPARVVLNVGGLLIGAVETTSQACIHSLAQLLSRPAVLAKARAAAAADDPAAFDGYAFEALRFHPISPYMFRVCEKPTTLAGGTTHATRIKAGAIVLPLVQSAAFDEAEYREPERFDPTRPLGGSFHLGMGLHECLGRAVAQVMIPEIVRQCLRRPDLTAIGPIDYGGGPFPESYRLRWQA